MKSSLSEKQKNRIRAIILAVLLPVWNIITNQMPIHYSLAFFYKWGLASCFLYLLWQFLYRISEKDEKYHWLKVGITVLFIASTAYVLFVILLLQESEDIRWFFIIKFLMAVLLFILIQYGLKANNDRVKLQMEKQQMLAENYRVQLQELRTKVDPHFLFNSLNTLRAMVHNEHKDAEKFIMSLSDFYRQTLKYNELSIVPILEELKVLNSYLFLMDARNQGGMNVKIEVNEKFMPYKLPTLALQILLENCFKHNRMSVTNPLEISIYSTENEYICVKNNLQPKMTPMEPSGYGLKNIRKRYELLGIVDEPIIVDQNEEFFQVKLKLIRG